MSLAGSARDVDDLGVREVRLDVLDAPFDEALLLARGVILGVLAQIAVRARLGDRLDDARPVLGLEALQLAAQALGALQRQRHPFHDARTSGHLLVQILQPVHVDLVHVRDAHRRSRAPPRPSCSR